MEMSTQQCLNSNVVGKSKFKAGRSCLSKYPLRLGLSKQKSKRDAFKFSGIQSDHAILVYISLLVALYISPSLNIQHRYALYLGTHLYYHTEPLPSFYLLYIPTLFLPYEEAEFPTSITLALWISGYHTAWYSFAYRLVIYVPAWIAFDTRVMGTRSCP